MLADAETGRESRRKREGERGRSAPPVSDKGPLPPFCFGFRSPCQDREASHVTAVSQCHRSERESTSGRERQTDRGRERQTEGEGESGTMPQTERGQAFIAGQEKNNNSSRLNWMRKPCGLTACWCLLIRDVNATYIFTTMRSILKSLKCAVTFSRQIISKCSVNTASQIISSTPPGTN